MSSFVSEITHVPAMRMINTKAHALTDYILGMVLIGSPYLFMFPPFSPAHYCCMLAGVIIISLALFTRFEYSLVSLMPVKVHMWCDAATGILLLLSPVILGFGSMVFKPHLVFGLTILVVAILTDRVLHLRENGRDTPGKTISDDSEKKKNPA